MKEADRTVCFLIVHRAEPVASRLFLDDGSRALFQLPDIKTVFAILALHAESMRYVMTDL